MVVAEWTQLHADGLDTEYEGLLREAEAKAKACGVNKWGLWGFQYKDVLRASLKQNLLLAYQMGLGKTRTSMAIGTIYGSKHILIVAPKRLWGEWVSDVRDLGLIADFQIIENTADLRRLKKYNLVSLSDLWRIPDDSPHRKKRGQANYREREVGDTIKKIMGVKYSLAWHMRKLFGSIIVDEAYVLKDIETNQTRAVTYLKAKHKVLLTGTPVRGYPNNILCIDGSQRVWMSDGSRVPIQEVVRKRLPGPVRCIDPRSGRLVNRPVTSWYENPLAGRKLVRVMFEDGGSLKLTEDHQVLTPRGMVEARGLRPGEEVHAEGCQIQGRELHGVRPGEDATCARDVRAVLQEGLVSKEQSQAQANHYQVRDVRPDCEAICQEQVPHLLQPLVQGREPREDANKESVGKAESQAEGCADPVHLGIQTTATRVHAGVYPESGGGKEALGMASSLADVSGGDRLLPQQAHSSEGSGRSRLTDERGRGTDLGAGRENLPVLRKAEPGARPHAGPHCPADQRRCSRYREHPTCMQEMQPEETRSGTRRIPNALGSDGLLPEVWPARRIVLELNVVESESQQVYCLGVEEAANFVVEGVVVHNCLMNWAFGNGSDVWPDYSFYREGSVKRFLDRFGTYVFMSDEHSKTASRGQKKLLPKIKDPEGFQEMLAAKMIRRLNTEPEVMAYVRIPVPSLVYESVGMDERHRKVYEKVLEDFKAWYEARQEEAEEGGRAIGRHEILVKLMALISCAAFPQAKDEAWRKSGEAGATAKQKRALELMDKYVAEGRKVMVLSENVDCAKWMFQRAEERHYEPMYVDGTVSLAWDRRTWSSKRLDRLRAFRQSESSRVLVGTTKCLAEGLNLPEASAVIFMDYDWVPSIMAQAFSRVLRPQQKRDVWVHFLTCKGTIEEYMELLCDCKQRSISEGLDYEEYDFNVEDLPDIKAYAQALIENADVLSRYQRRRRLATEEDEQEEAA